jgi:hypothetical protein
MGGGRRGHGSGHDRRGERPKAEAAGHHGRKRGALLKWGILVQRVSASLARWTRPPPTPA